jgi:hypothetical protein
MMLLKYNRTNMKPLLSIAGIAIIFLFIFLPGKTQAQEKNEEVTIIAPYKPSVTSAIKINRNPRISMEESGSLPEVEYQIRSKRVNTAVTPEQPRASRKPGEPSKDLYRSHIRAGFGNYLTPYFELWVNSLQSDRFNAGAHIGHISSYGKIKDYASSKYSNTLFEAFADKYYRGGTFGAKVDYKRNMVHRYGFKPEDFPGLDIPDDDIKQVYQKIGFHAGVESNDASEYAFNYYVNLDGYHYFDKYESRETAIFFAPGLSKKVDLFGNRRGQEFGLDMNLDYYMNKDSVGDHNDGLFGARPYLDMNLQPYRIYVGVQADYVTDTASSKFHIYPVIRAEASLLEDVIVVYAGMEGGMKKNSFESLSRENPYMNSIVPLGYSNYKFVFYGGIKGRLNKIVDYSLQARHSTIEDMPLFVTDTSNMLGNTFNVIYDDAGLFQFNGELGFRSKSNFGLILKAGFYAYSMDKEDKAWHKPQLSASLVTYYIVKEKLTLSLDLTTQAGAEARTFSGQDVIAKKLDAWLDLGLGAEYRITERFSAFVKFNNLLNQGYQKWYNYPVQKFNFLAGVGFSF